MADAAAPSIHVELAQRLADASGAVIRRHFRTPVAVDAKGDASPVTIADRDAEAAIRALLKAEVPDHGILGEEHGSEGLDAEYVWVIDPIDGTKSFITGRPIFGTLIALFHRGRPIVGIIDQPILRERWVGASGQPTLFNGEVVRARACPRLDLATLTTTSPDLFDATDGAAFRRLQQACRYTSYGSDCYGYALVALGFLDLVLESGLKSYDWGALVPVLEGAGASVTDWDGKSPELGVTSKLLVAGDPALHAAALKLIA
jgi:inositol-phosphate phosphatase/L-galactose 1-phosphate phosphatase/histidinol-phosphatase